jgi:hypothetical protein
MTAYNIVRMRVKPGREGEFLELNRSMDETTVARMKQNGFRHGAIVKTGERSYCFLGEWESMNSIVSSRADMIKDLDRMRDLLEDLGGGLGITDPISGEAILEFP